MALKNYDRDILLLLLEQGADPNLCFSKNVNVPEYPMDYAWAHLHSGNIWFEVISILEHYGAETENATFKALFVRYKNELAGMLYNTKQK